MSVIYIRVYVQISFITVFVQIEAPASTSFQSFLTWLQFEPSSI